jgi:hypothetical protein
MNGTSAQVDHIRCTLEASEKVRGRITEFYRPRGKSLKKCESNDQEFSNGIVVADPSKLMFDALCRCAKVERVFEL